MYKMTGDNRNLVYPLHRKCAEMEGVMYYFYDATYVLVIIGAVIGAIASWNVNATFKRYRKVGNSRGLTGAAAAQMILNSAGVYDVRIERINGNLTDHYSPKEKVLRLSDSTYDSQSVGAIGVAAHECGHAIQHQKEYLPIKIRSAVIPIANIGSSLSWPLILLGLVLGFTGFMKVGVILFSVVVILQLVTLPVEFNASSRALRILRENNMLYGNELSGARKVLVAAALTYVAALLTSILQLARLLILTRDRD